MKKTLLFVAAGLLISLSSFAQKFGYINSDELMQSMPEYAKAITDLQTYQNTFIDQGKTMYTEYQTKVADYQKNVDKWNDAMKETKENEIQDLQGRMQSLDSSMQAKVAQKQKDLMKPIIDKVKKAIEDVGKENNYEFIFDTQNVLYAKDQNNATNLVKAKLGIK